jgi:hypothetical protein
MQMLHGKMSNLACWCESNIMPEEIDLPCVHYTSGRPQGVLEYICWDPLDVKYNKLKHIKKYKCNPAINGFKSLFGYPREIRDASYYAFYCHIICHQNMIRELHRNYARCPLYYSYKSLYYPCHENKLKVYKMTKCFIKNTSYNSSTSRTTQHPFH